MNREDYFKYLTLNDELYALARARLKVKDILYIQTEKDKVIISYVPYEVEKLTDEDVITREFDLTEFLGD